VRIAQLGTNTERVPPAGYGGIELVTSLLTETLCQRGHEVTLFASGDSLTQARLISVTDSPLRTSSGVPQRRWQAYDLQTLLRLQEMQNEFDVVHNHMGYQALPFLDKLDCAVVTTNHNPIKAYNLPIYQTFRHLPYVAISNAYKELNYPETLNYIGTVYNGIDLNAFPMKSRKNGSFLLFLGRICEDKGTSEAIKIAQELSLPLKIAGKVDEPDQAYFQSQIKPQLNSSIEYVGEVGHQGKVALYHEAIALLHPINFEEPFGLTMIESLACGTPVMALDRGSVREVLADPETAIVGKSLSQLTERFSHIAKIKAENCRKRVEQCFSSKTMAKGYETVYQTLINVRAKETTENKFRTSPQWQNK
jgi:glycosyltransferase involved in cell wall biosynthesis